LNDTIQDIGTISKMLNQYKYGNYWKRDLIMIELCEGELDWKGEMESKID
jgi:hypothetical protein